METTKWTLDPTHSELNFRIKHLMITNVSGNIKKFTVGVTTSGDDFTTAKIKLDADLDSISTNNEQRDAHLRTGDFFEIEKYPQLHFQSEKITRKDDENFIVHGNLSIKGITKPVKLDVEMGGIATDPWGNEKAGFVVTGKINRADWGINFNSALETGGLLLGEEVKIAADIQLVKQVVAVPA